MYYQRTTNRTLAAAQNQSEARRLGRFSTVGRVNKMVEGRLKPFQQCQYIRDEPTKAEVRRHGADNFKCLAAVKQNRPYCEAHCERCFQKAPLTEVTE